MDIEITDELLYERATEALARANVLQAVLTAAFQVLRADPAIAAALERALTVEPLFHHLLEGARSPEDQHLQRIAHGVLGEVVQDLIGTPSGTAPPRA